MQGMPFTPLSPAPEQLILAHSSSQWKTIRSMLGLVIVVFMIVQITTLIFYGLYELDAAITLVSSLCLLPFVLLFVSLRKPKLAHVIRGNESIYGSQFNIINPSTVIQSPTPLVLQHHIVHNSAPLEMPRGMHLWLLFFSGVLVSSMFMLPLLLFGATVISLSLALLVAIPALLVGFSTPVFAWWSTSHRYFGLPTSRRMGEWMLIAGMFSTLPAIIVNSLVGPLLLEAVGMDTINSSSLGFGIILFGFAPIGEEIFKACAVLTLARVIDSRRRGFQVGFTVGLGFALLENLGYILSSFAVGDAVAVNFALTSILRGISSIPGHGVWTGISGYAIGSYLVSRQRNQLYDVMDDASNRTVKPNWMLVNSRGEVVEQSSGSGQERIDVPVWLCASQDKAWPLPVTPVKGVGLAILGHSFWNGSLWGTELLFSSLPTIQMVGVQLGWITFMIVALWYITRRIIPTALGESNRSSKAF
ncbi:MAG: hypothetical protein CMA63_04895 [Euryarchaeota archaeon]|nr:hypothetical protein [Euryarchaeota archaeon]